MSDTASSVCPRFHHAVELIGRRWTGAIIRTLQQGRTRFKGIALAIPEMSDRMLSERLRELEHEDIIVRIVIPETPVRIEYELTEKGRALDAAFCAIAQWAERWVLPEPESTRDAEPRALGEANEAEAAV